MKLAILSDIHSNFFALKAVIEDAEKNNVQGYILLGDIFGYYPWASETYELLTAIPIIKAIKGNHDALLREKETTAKLPAYWEMAWKNRVDLEAKYPKALSWLAELSYSENFTLDGVKCKIVHGTPDDPINGRYYPDDATEYEWLQEAKQILMMGHTHYPLCRKNLQNGWILNPGSVGQPRDGNVFSSWGIFDFAVMRYEAKRSPYDVKSAVEVLKRLKWDQRSIAALTKDYVGRLRE